MIDHIVRPATVDDLRVLNPTLSEDQAKVNIMTGPAYVCEIEGALVFSGGVRMKHMGEAWWITHNKLRDEIRTSIELQRLAIEVTRGQLAAIVEAHRLYRVWAENKISDRFIEAIGLKKNDNAFLWELE